jgi:hypothetical protein
MLLRIEIEIECLLTAENIVPWKKVAEMMNKTHRNIMKKNKIKYKAFHKIQPRKTVLNIVVTWHLAPHQPTVEETIICNPKTKGEKS